MRDENIRKIPFFSDNNFFKTPAEISFFSKKKKNRVGGEPKQSHTSNFRLVSTVLPALKSPSPWLDRFFLPTSFPWVLAFAAYMSANLL